VLAFGKMHDCYDGYLYIVYEMTIGPSTNIDNLLDLERLVLHHFF
jgi:hypothetical protein